MYFKKIKGERVYLSPMCIEDAEKYTKWVNDFEVTDKINSSTMVLTLEAEKAWLEKNSGIGNYQFAIVKQENDELIGNCSLHKVDFINQTATVGIFIGDEENRGKGYGSEALKLLLSYGFDYLNLNNIMLVVYSFNSQAVACYKKVGFNEFGIRKEAYFQKNKRHDKIYMEILRSEYYKKNNK